MKIDAITAVVWNVPMCAPYRSAQRITTVARNVLVTVTLEDGAVGYGEAAPATYVTGETQESVVNALNRLFAEHFRRGEELEQLLAAGRARLETTPGALSALTTAVLDATARSSNMPFFHALGKAEGGFSRATDLSLPILPSDEAMIRAAQAARDGFRSLKIKVGSGDAATDEARVRAVADAAPNAMLRLDGNQGFTGPEAVSFLDTLTDLLPRIELFEQPTRAGDDGAMAFVAKRIPIPVFADESCHDPDDARRLVGEGICGGVVLKLAKSDPQMAFAIGQAAYEAGGKCLFGCMMETRVGITAALHVAVALGAKVVPMLDLDGHLLVNDMGLVEGGLTQEGDLLTIDPTIAGLGVTVRPPDAEPSGSPSTLPA